MAQHDFTVDNSTGLAVRNDINDAIQALATLSSGATTPSTTFADQLWLDTSASPPVLWVRNPGNTAWDLSEATNGFFNTRAAVAAATIEADVDIVTTKGYAAFGDEGGATYKRGSEPSHALKVSSNGGTIWWEIVPTMGEVTFEQAGAAGDDTADDATAIQAAMDYCWDTGTTLKMGARTYKIGSTIDFAGANVSVSTIDMPYKIVGSGAHMTVFNYTGAAVAVQMVHATTQKSIQHGIIEGGFSVLNGGTGTIGIHFKGMNQWNTTGATLKAKDFSDKNIYLEDNNGKGGLWNSYGSLISEQTGTGAWGVYVDTVANANHFIRILTKGDYTSSCCYLRGNRNVYGLVSCDIQTPTNLVSAVRFDGHCVVYGIELESSGSFTGTAAIVFDNDAIVELHMPLITGFGATQYSYGTDTTVLLTPSIDVSTPISGGRVRLNTSNGLWIEIPLLDANPFYLSTNVDNAVIGVSNTYGSYQTLLTLSHAANSYGTRLLRSLFVTNNSDETVEFQIRHFDAGSSAGTNNLSKTVTSGGTYEFTAHELSFIIDNTALRTYTIRARFRTVQSSLIGDMDFDYGGNNV